MTIQHEHSERLKEILARGLCSGKGREAGGQVCIEQAIAIACGCSSDDGRATDGPDCVAPAVRAHAIVLNDAGWSSPEVRTRGLTAYALAQLGTQLLDEKEFARRLAIATVNRILPGTLRKLAALPKIQELGSGLGELLEASAKSCEGAQDLSAAESAAKSAARSAESAARSASWSAARSAASAAESAARSAAESAESAARSAASAAESASWSAAESAESAARSAARSAESASWSAAESASWSAAESARDEVLISSAQVVTEVLDGMREEDLK